MSDARYARGYNKRLQQHRIWLREPSSYTAAAAAAAVAVARSFEFQQSILGVYKSTVSYQN
jgi:hypothetical protein